MELLNHQPWKRLSQILLVYSAVGFFLLIALVASNSSFFYFGAENMVGYLIVVGLTVLLFPLSIGLILAGKNMITPTVTIVLVAVSVAAFSFAVALIPVPESFPFHCLGTGTGYWSVSYYLFGFGSHLDIVGCL